MAPFEVLFKATHGCRLSRLCERFPSARIFSWPNSMHEVIEIVLRDRTEHKELRNVLSDMINVVDQSFNGESTCLVTKKSGRTFENSISMRLEAHNMLCLPPVAYEGGCEYYHAIGFRHGDFRKFIESASEMPAEITIMHKSYLDSTLNASLPISVSGIFRGLTQKQVDALLSSHGMGYFKFPRKKNVQDIAETKGIPRTTFQEHLTKAENKLVNGLVPYLKLHGAMARFRRAVT